MSEHELDMWMAFLCAAYDGASVTVERNKRGKIVDVEVHEPEANPETEKDEATQ